MGACVIVRDRKTKTPSHMGLSKEKKNEILASVVGSLGPKPLLLEILKFGSQLNGIICHES